MNENTVVDGVMYDVLHGEAGRQNELTAHVDPDGKPQFVLQYGNGRSFRVTIEEITT